MIAFTVPGLAVTQGDLKPITVRGVTRLIHKKDAALRDFRARVAICARQAGVRPMEGAVELEATWWFLRPKSHLTSKGALCKGAPIYPITRPDLDKLERALFDALTGIAYPDDARVVSVRKKKRYAAAGEVARVEVLIWSPEEAF